MMETLGMGIMGEKSFYDVPEHDLLGVWDSDIGTNVHDSLRVSSSMIDGNSHDTLWNSGLFDSQPGVIRNDKLLTDSVMSPLLLPSASSTCSSTSSSAATSPSSFLQSPTFTSVQTNNPPVKTEHSYSMIGGAGTAGSDGDSIPDSPLSNTDDMESECYPCIPMNSEAVTSVPSAASMSPSSSISSMTGVVKLEPMSPDEESDTGYFSNELFRNSVNYVIKEELSSPKSANKAKTNPNLLRSSHNQPTLLVSRGANKNAVSNRLVFPKVNLKVEPYSPGSSNNATTCTMSPPSTPLPSSEQGRSPVTVTAASAVTQPSTTNMFKGPMAATNTTKVVFGHPTTSSRHPIQTSLISNQPKGATGMLHLTEEEKRTLISEGYPVPQRLPLTKSEEKSLKKIRRKIKNKISAQESRRKKKEYMDCLERRMQGLNREMEAYKQKCGSLESQNASLLVQVQKLQAQLAGNKSTDQSR